MTEFSDGYYWALILHNREVEVVRLDGDIVSLIGREETLERSQVTLMEWIKPYGDD